jgi:hypothetical protein
LFWIGEELEFECVEDELKGFDLKGMKGLPKGNEADRSLLLWL